MVLRVVAISREFLLVIQGGCSKSLGPFFSEDENDLPQVSFQSFDHVELGKLAVD